MGWLALIRAALEAIAAIPKIWNQILTSNINGRLQKLEEKHAKIEAAYELVKNAKTNQEKLDAISLVADSWRSL